MHQLSNTSNHCSGAAGVILICVSFYAPDLTTKDQFQLGFDGSAKTYFSFTGKRRSQSRADKVVQNVPTDYLTVN